MFGFFARYKLHNVNYTQNKNLHLFKHFNKVKSSFKVTTFIPHITYKITKSLIRNRMLLLSFKTIVAYVFLYELFQLYDLSFQHMSFKYLPKFISYYNERVNINEENINLNFIDINTIKQILNTNTKKRMENQLPFFKDIKDFNSVYNNLEYINKTLYIDKLNRYKSNRSAFKDLFFGTFSYRKDIISFCNNFLSSFKELLLSEYNNNSFKDVYKKHINQLLDNISIQTLYKRVLEKCILSSIYNLSSYMDQVVDIKLLEDILYKCNNILHILQNKDIECHDNDIISLMNIYLKNIEENIKQQTLSSNNTCNLKINISHTDVLIIQSLKNNIQSRYFTYFDTLHFYADKMKDIIIKCMYRMYNL